MMTDNFGNVNHLVLNFYPDGYSIAVKLNEFPVFTSETILETAKISYEETSLLDYIENEELPPLLVEMIDGSPKLSQYKIWHNGCLILEVRDKININYDDSTPRNTAKDYFILLKPTNLSMLNDVLNLTESNSWSTQDRLQLESQIVLYNSPPLFLEPDATKQPSEQGSHWIQDLTVSNNHTRNKKRLPHTRLRRNFNSIKIGASHNNQNNYSSGNTTNRNNGNNNNIYPNTTECLPPELTLQQFLATKRAKKSFPAGQLARFHRFKKHLFRNN